jgi:hypothetical protein
MKRKIVEISINYVISLFLIFIGYLMARIFLDFFPVLLPYLTQKELSSTGYMEVAYRLSSPLVFVSGALLIFLWLASAFTYLINSDKGNVKNTPINLLYQFGNEFKFIGQQTPKRILSTSEKKLFKSIDDFVSFLKFKVKTKGGGRLQ